MGLFPKKRREQSGPAEVGGDDVDVAASLGLGDDTDPAPPEAPSELPTPDATDQLGDADWGWHLPDLSEISASVTPPPPPSPGDQVTFDDPEPEAPLRSGVASEGRAAAPEGPGPNGPEAVAHLEVLGLIPGSSWEEIRSAHAELVVGYAQIPESDTRHQRVAAEMCREINTAYASLRLMAAA